MRNDLFLPNEDLMEILNLFFTQFIFKERGHASGNNEAIDDKYFIIETNKNRSKIYSDFHSQISARELPMRRCTFDGAVL